MRVQLVAGEHKVALPPEAAEELQLKDGDAVEILRAPEIAGSRYISVDEAMKIFYETEPRHREAYKALAKL